MNISEKFGIAIRAARAGVGVSQDVLAEKSDTSRPTINRIENNGAVKMGSIDAVVAALKDLGAKIDLTEEEVVVRLTTMCNSNDS